MCRTCAQIFLHLSDRADWYALVNAMYTAEAITSAHVLCGSRIYFQTATSPARSTHATLHKWRRPQWLDPQVTAERSCERAACMHACKTWH